jgi:hypothetical protein
MCPKSVFYDLSLPPPAGWSEQDFAWAVQQLEQMSRDELVRLCKLPEIQLRFTDYTPAEAWEQLTPVDEIISALLVDYSSQTLLRGIDDAKEIRQR